MQAQVSEPDAPTKPDSAVRPLTAQDRAESWVLGGLLAQPQRWAKVQQFVSPQDFTNARRKSLAGVYWDYQRDEGEPAFNELLAVLEPDLKDLALELLEAVDGLENLDQTLSDAIDHMRQMRRRMDERKLLTELRRTVDSPEPAANEIELLRKLQEQARTPDIRRTAT